MRNRKIIGACLIIIGLGVLGVSSAYALGIVASTILIVAGLVMAFMNRAKQI